MVVGSVVVGADVVGATVSVDVTGATVGSGVVGGNDGTAVGGADDGASIGDNVGLELVGEAVGDAVIQTHVCPAVVQSPSEQRCVVAQLQRRSAPPSSCSQMPYSVPSQLPCDPSLQECRVGWIVGEVVVGREVVGSSVGAAVEEAVVQSGVGDADCTVGQMQGNAGVIAEAQMGSSSISPNTR